MPFRWEHVVRDAPVAVSAAARAKLLEFFTELGISPAAAVELRVWFEKPETPDPRDGVLTAQVRRVQTTPVATGTPPPDVFNITNVA